jgi:hypothetical protein
MTFPEQYYDVPVEKRFRNFFAESRYWDFGWNSYLVNYEANKSVNPTADVLNGVSDEALNYYTNLKQHEQVDLTVLDAFIIANAYHAQLTIYDVEMVSTCNNWSHTTHNEYNFDSEKLPRPIWGMVYDSLDGRYYPVLDEITDKMYYGFKPDRWATLLVHESPEGSRCTLK